MPPKVLQIIFEMKSQGTIQKRIAKLFIFLHFDPSYFQTS